MFRIQTGLFTETGYVKFLFLDYEWKKPYFCILCTVTYFSSYFSFKQR